MTPRARRPLWFLPLLTLVACTPPKDTVPKSFVRACAADTASIRTAEETYRAADPDGNYATPDKLVPGFLSEFSRLHGVTDVVAVDPSTNTPSSYKIRVADKRCGVTSSANDANLVDDAHPDNH
jgi:hypothetical protein